jgi:predicted nucleotidyltransferase
MPLTPEELTEKLKAACGANLRSAVLYGSSAAGDRLKASDHNVLLVLDRVAGADLLALAGATAAWTDAGNPPPLVFAREELRRSADVFPVELADIRDSRRVLWGEDPLEGIEPDPANLRHQLERELKEKQLRLRDRFLLTGGRPREVERLLAGSLSSLLVLFRAALRLHGERPPAKKLEALAALRRRIEFDDGAFREAWELKEGRRPAGLDALALFDRYLKAVQTVTDAVDRWSRPA